MPAIAYFSTRLKWLLPINQFSRRGRSMLLCVLSQSATWPQPCARNALSSYDLQINLSPRVLNWVQLIPTTKLLNACCSPKKGNSMSLWWWMCCYEITQSHPSEAMVFPRTLTVECISTFCFISWEGWQHSPTYHTNLKCTQGSLMKQEIFDYESCLWDSPIKILYIFHKVLLPKGGSVYMRCGLYFHKQHP